MQCQTGARVRVRHRSSISGRRSESDTSDVYRTYLKMIRQDGYCTIHCPSSTHHLSTHLDHQHRRRCTCILPRCLKSMKGTGGVWRIDSDWVYIEWRPALKMGGEYTVLSLGPWSVQIRTIVAFLWISKFCCRLNSVFRPQHWGGPSS